ncbi:TPA: 3-methyladenine DNA glycosylase [Candidatus Dependentiae bacterium]|nr:MAG: hypothetical protein UR14_C0001G0062 [candidate division TM6 bacterium GW2011_GWE2_31_21]KKP54058.1 MAG: hypothetical protein UR43_C0001G0076 [candidate division TM6 bacterium GW2011_GWF2_33_332]HBS48360.1 3-methyladenine DNA glycosylase [Candidatus Dependentiae bacterium]HBZ72966.1 3-methyladenine DNA glycosylase [Candidatus Dependentiae bacterium]
MNILNQDFFDKPVLEVAPKLLGKLLVRKIENQTISLMITEVEAYDGPLDLASHGRFGKTKRNEVMFGPAGYFYVYLIYGMYQMLNIVTGPKDYPAAILIRGVKNIKGPGRLTKQLKIDKSFNGLIANKTSNLWFEDNEIQISQNEIIATPRIGVEYAKEWAQKEYRFLLK